MRMRILSWNSVGALINRYGKLLKKQRPALSDHTVIHQERTILGHFQLLFTESEIKRLEMSTEHMRKIFGMQDAYVKKMERDFHVTIVDRNGEVNFSFSCPSASSREYLYSTFRYSL